MSDDEYVGKPTMNADDERYLKELRAKMTPDDEQYIEQLRAKAAEIRAEVGRSTAAAPDLGKWWVETAQADLDAFYPKFKEYGASDLLVVGSGVCPAASDGVRTEAGIMFHLLSKAARGQSAYLEGRGASDDTLLDLSVYSMMIRRVRAIGRLG